MKFTVDKSRLQSAAEAAARGSSKKSPIPALEGIHIAASDGKLTITGYDMTIGIRTEIEADVSASGNTVLPGKAVLNILKSLSAGDVSFELTDLELKINSGKTSFEISCIDGSTFPELPECDASEEISLPKDVLCSMVKQTSFASSDNMSRPIYTGELFEVENGMLTVVACDGYRVALRRQELDDADAKAKFIAPASSLQQLVGLCSGDEDENIAIGLDEKHIIFTVGKTTLISRRLEGTFIDYKKTVPVNFNTSLLIKKNALKDSIARCAVVITDTVKAPVNMLVDPDGIGISVATALGKAADYCAANGETPGLEISANYRYIQDALKAIPDDEVRVCGNTATSPLVILPPDGDAFVYMILPVRPRRNG